MSTLTQFANVSITSATQTPSRVGFGTPLVLGYFTAWPDRVRTYSSLTAMVADGINSRMRDTFADTSRAKADLGFQQKTSLADGLKAECDWLAGVLSVK